MLVFTRFSYFCCQIILGLERKKREGNRKLPLSCLISAWIGLPNIPPLFLFLPPYKQLKMRERVQRPFSPSSCQFLAMKRQSANWNHSKVRETGWIHSIWSGSTSTLVPIWELEALIPIPCQFSMYTPKRPARDGLANPFDHTFSIEDVEFL